MCVPAAVMAAAGCTARSPPRTAAPQLIRVQYRDGSGELLPLYQNCSAWSLELHGHWMIGVPGVVLSPLTDRHFCECSFLIMKNVVKLEPASAFDTAIRTKCWFALPLHGQMMSCVPFAVDPAGTSRHLPEW